MLALLFALLLALPIAAADPDAALVYTLTPADVAPSAASIDGDYQPPNKEPGWSGNFTRNPGFEEDFVNVNCESHVLSFKGDWYYNQKDLVPDYWSLKGDWSWSEHVPHAQARCLKLGDGATASQSFPRALSQHGGGAWGGVENRAIPISDEELPRFNLPWRASVWVRGGGTLAIGCGQSVTATADAKADWQLLTVELPAEQIGKPDAPLTLSLTGPGEFDDVVLIEKLPDSPNLATNAGFEQVDDAGYPAAWSKQQKFRAIGPTYYVWTDWNHAFAENRGPVTTDTLVARRGRRSLRFDVYPGDEKLVESELITLNQQQPRVIEIGAWVRADRIKLIDVRCVNEEGHYMPGYRPRQPEYSSGGTFTYGNGTFGWRYVRKFFATTQGKPVKGIRVRLCARGMNGHTLDDAGTRPYAMAVGTVWWDDVQVYERTSTAAELASRGVKIPPVPATPPPAVEDGAVDLGERFVGPNTLAYRFVNRTGPGTFQLQLKTTLPGGEPVTTSSKPLAVAPGQRAALTAPYVIAQLVGELEKQGTFDVTLQKDGQPIGQETYGLNTWPAVIDIDVSRHYNLPGENPVTASLNLGVSRPLLTRAKRLELELVRIADGQVLSRQSVGDLQQAIAQSLASLPEKKPESYEFNLPTPAWWVDRTNLLLTKLDLAALKVWPHDHPTRDTVLVVRALDAGGQEIFRDQSDPFCRMQPTPPQPAVQSVAVREDGAVLINGAPRFLTGATHQNQRIAHTLPIIAQLGLMGHRLTQQMTFQQHLEMWDKHRLYALQMKPGNKIGGTAPVVELTPEQKQEFEAFVRTGGMQNVVSINTGGWEATINFGDPEQVKKHVATNEYIRGLAGRPLAVSTSGAYNAWWLPKLEYYDINHAETEMWGPMDFNVVYMPYMKERRQRNTTWVYLPQLYDNHPYGRYRFETYENIIRGSAGVSMIQGIGDPTFNRGLAGELRYLESPLNSQEPPPEVTLEPNVSHKIARQMGKTYILATNAGPIACGRWTWNSDIKHSGRASHEGDSWNQQWFRPGGVRIHGFRGMPLPERIKQGDKLVQYVWIDPEDAPEWAMVAVRGNGRFAHNVVLGEFDFARFREARGNLLMYSELNHSVWHEVNYVMDDETYDRAVKVMGKDWADNIKKFADLGRENVDKLVYQPEHFRSGGPLPAPGEWHRIEIDADEAGLVGKLVDGFAYLIKDGRALWDYSVLERDGETVRVFCEDSVGIDRGLLESVRISVPGLKPGTRIKVLFENREITADDGGFTDNFVGTDTYGYESRAPEGDLFGFVRDPDRELARMMPSGHGYNYGPTAVHIYEIEH